MATNLERILCTLWLSLLAVSIGCLGAQVKVNVEHDMSRPTYGLQGPSSSQITYDDRHGLNLKGTINDILGPPLKIANGLGQLLTGSNMAGVGQSLKSGSAMLGFDAKLLEAAGGANLVRGGFLQSAADVKNAAASSMAGKAGRAISNVIEVPIRVVAMKDLASGHALQSLGQAKGTEAQVSMAKGEALAKEGHAIKNKAINQIMEGASEGVTNIGNFVQQTAGNAATAIRALPIILDLPTSGGQSTSTSSQQHQDSSKNTMRSEGSAVGGSPFGGLNTLMGGSSPADSFLGGATGASIKTSSSGSAAAPFSLFGGSHFASGGSNNNAYAALMNATSPFMNLLSNPALNPFVMPLSQGPLGQSLAGKGPIGGSSSTGSNSGSNHFGIFPFLRVTEQFESSPFQRFFPSHNQQQQLYQPQLQPQQQQQQQQQQIEQTATKSAKS